MTDTGETPSTQPSREEMQAALEAQRHASESVASLASQLDRLRVTHAMRIDEIPTEGFTYDLKSAHATRLRV